jgi:hypothetical protein
LSDLHAIWGGKEATHDPLMMFFAAKCAEICAEARSYGVCVADALRARPTCAVLADAWGARNTAQGVFCVVFLPAGMSNTNA